MAVCRTCGGSGQTVCSNSHFIADGFRLERCGVCAGSGESSYTGDPTYNRMQAAKRALISRFGKLKPDGDAETKAWLAAVNAAYAGPLTRV